MLPLLCGCEGVFGWVYDEPEPVVPAEGQILVDATSWTDWYYIRLDEASCSAAYPIPAPTGDATTVPPDSHLPGRYLYWFDVWDKGLSHNAFREFVPIGVQPEPEVWDIAVHRNNVRTNGGAVCETTYTDIDDARLTAAACATMTFTPDSWSENEVWCSQDKMLQSLVPSQGIMTNKVLSGWLSIAIPPVPPSFSHNNHVFVLRFSDGSYAALQLADYLSPTGVKCYLTINYRYPL